MPFSVCFPGKLQPVDCNYRPPSADGRSGKIGYHAGTLLRDRRPTGAASMVIETYSFERASTGKLVVLDHSSFMLAAIGGPIYVLLSGFLWEALAMVVVTVLIAGAAVFAIVAAIGLFDSLLTNLAAALFIPLAALFLQGRAAIRLTRRGYLRQGWIERY